MGVYICEECKKDNHKQCLTTLSCDCKCNIGGFADVTQKALSTLGGIGMVAGGLLLSLGTGGLAIPIGGAMMGAGISSAYQGIEKTIKEERINAVEYCADVGFGAVTGVLTGGIGASGEVIAANVAKEGTKKLAIRAATGGVTGASSKVINEVKECLTTDKKWSEFGQTVDKNGNTSVSGTAAAWGASIVTGGLGGAATHISTGFTNAASSGIGRATTRIAVSATTSVSTDALSQGINIAAGNQDEYDIKRTILAGTTSVITTAAMEGVENSIYAAHGGREKFYADKTNKELIEKNVPKSQQKNALNAYKDVQEMDKSSKSSKKMFGDSKAHVLKKQQSGQIAADVKDPGATSRGGERLLFKKEDNIIKYSGYTQDHYKTIIEDDYSACNIRLKAHNAATDYQRNGIISALEEESDDE